MLLLLLKILTLVTVFSLQLPTILCCVCTQPLNPQFLCVDDECESNDNLVHHYCNSNFIIKIMIISDRLFSAIPGSFNTRVGYRFKLVHTYKLDEGQAQALDSNIIWSSQDTCGVAFKKGRLYLVSGAVDRDRQTARTSTCDYVRPVKDLKLDEINFFGYKHRTINCTRMEMIEILSPDMLENHTAPIETDADKALPLTKPMASILNRPILPDRACYCGPAPGGPGLSAINIGLGAANNNGENGWNNIQGGLNLAIASGNGNSGQGLGSVNPNGRGCVVGGDGNGNGGVNIGIGSGNNNGGNGWNIGNGGNNVNGSSDGEGDGDWDTARGTGGHNVGSNAGNGNGGTNIGIMSGNWNGLNGWNNGNGGNNAGDNTFNSHVMVRPTGVKEPGSGGTGAGVRENPGSSNTGYGFGGNNVGEWSGNGNGGDNWGLWSGNGNGYNGWNGGNGGNNAGDNVGNGNVSYDDEDGYGFGGDNSGIGGNNRGNNTGNGKSGGHHGFGSGKHNGNSGWNSGNGGNNVGDGSGNGVVGNIQPIPAHRKPPNRKPPGVWTTGLGNGGNNVGSGSGNGFGSKALPIEGNGVENKIIMNAKKSVDMDGSDGTDDKSHIKVLMDEKQSEIDLESNEGSDAKDVKSDEQIGDKNDVKVVDKDNQKLKID